MQSVEILAVEDVLDDFRSGRPVIIVDDADRENEGDIAIATECLTPEHVHFMTKEARGLVCVSISEQRAQELALPLQVKNNNSRFNTPFTISVDHRSVAGDGVTMSSRSTTMRALIDSTVSAEEFTSPGHVFPLIANPAGVIGRQGQTEGSYDLARLAGLAPSGVICEILNPDGTMARGASLAAFAQKHSLKLTSVAEIISYRINREVLLREVARAELETDFGVFLTVVFEDDVTGKEHLALVLGDVANEESVSVRVHSECLTGDVFGSLRCDCGEQLSKSMKKISESGAGILLYLRQEGRGIGLANKLKAYALQEEGHDTVEANIKLGFQADDRDFAVAARILSMLEVHSVSLMTNNPEKISRLENLGISIVERQPIVIPPCEHSQSYLETKKEKLGHLL